MNQKLLRLVPLRMQKATSRTRNYIVLHIARFVSDTFRKFQVCNTLNMSEHARYVKSVCGDPGEKRRKSTKISTKSYLLCAFFFKISAICGNALFGPFRPFHECLFEFYNWYSLQICFTHRLNPCNSVESAFL